MTFGLFQINFQLKFKCLLFLFCLQTMNKHQILATVALIIFCSAHFTDAARYVPKWKKQACEVPASQNEQSHYTCDDNGEVKCLPGNIVTETKSLFFFCFSIGVDYINV